MTTKTITEKAKLLLVESIQRDLASEHDEQHSFAAYGFVGVYNMNEDQLLNLFTVHGINPYEV
jgi:hypothetical protein